VQSLISGLLNGHAVAAVVLHFAPVLAPQLEARCSDVGRLLSSHKEVALAIIRALREGIEPFPKFSEVQISLDKLLMVDQLNGLGMTLATFLRTLSGLPAEQQHDVAPLALGGVARKVAEAFPDLALIFPCTSADM
jgi:hypothetical protein